MTRFSNLTLRNFLIATHDALATALALFASFYLRFEGGDAFFVRLPLLLRFLPYFILLSIVVCYIFNLTTTKWRFFSLPDVLNILRAATVLTLALLVLDYIFVAPYIHGSPVVPNIVGAFFAGKVTISTGTCTTPRAIARSERIPAPGTPNTKKPMPHRRAWTNATPITPLATERTVAPITAI